LHDTICSGTVFVLDPGLLATVRSVRPPALTLAGTSLLFQLYIIDGYLWMLNAS
jgi:hypothetical protein